MRTPLEKIARAIAKAPGSATIGELAKKHNETPERIIDAMDMLKLIEAAGALEESPLTYVEAN